MIDESKLKHIDLTAILDLRVIDVLLQMKPDRAAIEKQIRAQMPDVAQDIIETAAGLALYIISEAHRVANVYKAGVQ